MFPTPIHRASIQWRIAYRTLLPVSLFMWLLPLIAVAVFSIKPAEDFTTGNYWGLPASFEGTANYSRVFFDSDMPRYLLNSVLNHRAHCHRRRRPELHDGVRPRRVQIPREPLRSSSCSSPATSCRSRS